jgi:DNA-binding MarR family transcriptional regulator
VDRDQLLRDVALGLDRLNRRLGREWGPLTRAQWALVRRLMDGPVPVGLLAQRLDISTAGATRMLDKLEECGYVRRERQEGDLRQVSASLTDAGREALRQAWSVYLERFKKAVDPIADDDLERWHQLLAQMAPTRAPSLHE